MNLEMVGIGLATYCLVPTVNRLADSRYVPANIINGGVSVQIKLGLGGDKSVTTKQRWVKHTLKTWRSLFKSDFHAAITFLSSIEWTNREILPRPLRLKTFP